MRDNKIVTSPAERETAMQQLDAVLGAHDLRFITFVQVLSRAHLLQDAGALELAFVLARNGADFTHAVLIRALALEKAICGQKGAGA